MSIKRMQSDKVLSTREVEQGHGSTYNGSFSAILAPVL
jgi:hypothetical protein